MGQEEEAAKRSRAAPNNYVYYQPSWTPQHRRQPAPCGGSKPVARPARRRVVFRCGYYYLRAVHGWCALGASHRQPAGLELSCGDDNHQQLIEKLMIIIQ